MIDVERLTSAEVDALVQSGERACVRVATLPDGSVLTRDHPRAPRQAAAWMGAALAASALACSEPIAEEDVVVHEDRETRVSQRPAVAAGEAVYTLGGIGESPSIVDEMSLLPFDVKLD